MVIFNPVFNSGDNVKERLCLPNLHI